MINEMKQLRLLEERRGMKMPLPNFFYVERFGRCVHEQMDEILTGLGKREWFLFKTDIRSKEGGLIDNFTIELEKYAKLGKSYDECVLIEFAEGIHIEEEFEEFVSYLKSLEDKIYFLFTMKQSRNTAYVQKCIEQYFFVRTIEAKKYSVEEQLEEIKKICGEYKYTIDKEAEIVLKNKLEKKEWKAEEQVLCRLRNGVCSMVYEGLLQTELPDGASTWSFSSEMAEKMLFKMEPESKKRAIIGFNQGGLLYE